MNSCWNNMDPLLNGFLCAKLWKLLAMKEIFDSLQFFIFLRFWILYSSVVSWLYFSVFTIEKVLLYSRSRLKKLETQSVILGEGGSPDSILVFHSALSQAGVISNPSFSSLVYSHLFKSIYCGLHGLFLKHLWSLLYV